MWNSKNKIIRSALGLSLAMMLGCGLVPFQDNEKDRGSISFAVQFPKKGEFQTQLIQPETTQIFAAVYGASLPFKDPLISSPITRSQGGSSVARTELVSIPVGAQTVLVAAYNQENKILTAGKVETVVLGSSTTRVEIELIEAFNTAMTSEEVELLVNIPKDDPVKEPVIESSAPPQNQPSNVPRTEEDKNETPDPTSSTTPETKETTPKEDKEEVKPTPTPTPTLTPTPQLEGFSLTRPSGSISVSANSSVTLETSVLNSQITQVEFFVGNQKLGSVTTSPFSFVWQTTGFNDGDHEVKAVAKDVNGAVIATSQSRTVTLRRTTNTAAQPSVPPSPTATPTPTPSASPSINADINVVDGTPGAPGGPGAF